MPEPWRDGREPRWCARYPFFGDPARDIPDDVCDITSEMTLNACLEPVQWHGHKLRVANGFAFDLTSYPDITELQASTVHAGSAGCHGTTDWRAATEVISAK